MLLAWLLNPDTITHINRNRQASFSELLTSHWHYFLFADPLPSVKPWTFQTCVLWYARDSNLFSPLLSFQAVTVFAGLTICPHTQTPAALGHLVSMFSRFFSAQICFATLIRYNSPLCRTDPCLCRHANSDHFGWKVTGSNCQEIPSCLYLPATMNWKCGCWYNGLKYSVSEASTESTMATSFVLSFDLGTGT